MTTGSRERGVDDEFAAALAAVSRYLEEESQAAPAAMAHRGWLQAARREQLGGRPVMEPADLGPRASRSRGIRPNVEVRFVDQ